MADIMPTVAHDNVLWVMAYDDYPLDSIYVKQKWQERARNEEMWFVLLSRCKLQGGEMG